MKPPATDLESLLVQHDTTLLVFLGHEASGLLRFESLEDLAQGVHLRALGRRDSFHFLGEQPFLAWLRAIARHHIADRHEHWSAIKRHSGKVVRYTLSGSHTDDSWGALLPADSRSGPGTFASRRELLILVSRALGLLPPRDRDLVRWMSEGVAIEAQASQLNISYAAAQRAGLRAVERLRKTFELVRRHEGNRGPGDRAPGDRQPGADPQPIE